MAGRAVGATVRIRTLKAKADALCDFANSLEAATHELPLGDQNVGGYLRAAAKARIQANEYLAAAGLPARPVPTTVGGAR
jgi:hypothetical protein